MIRCSFNIPPAWVESGPALRGSGRLFRIVGVFCCSLDYGFDVLKEGRVVSGDDKEYGYGEQEIFAEM